MGYQVAEYKDTDIRIAVEPINLAYMRDQTWGYVVVIGNGEFQHEMEGDLYEALSHRPLIGLKSRLRYMSDRNHMFLMVFQSLLLAICF